MNAARGTLATTTRLFATMTQPPTETESTHRASPKPKSKWAAPMLAASLVLSAGGIAFFSAANNARPVKFSPVEGVAPAEPKSAPKVAPAKPEKIPDDIQWQPSFEAAMAQSKKSGKPLMVDFYTDWCGYCRKLDSDVFTDFGVISESVNFVSVKVNAEKAPALAQKYQVEGFPTIIWLGSDGTQLERLPGFIEAPGFLETMRSAHAKAASSAA